jgi:molybdopterin-containing oxidoreductase family iron-sulfur binding subunit
MTDQTPAQDRVPEQRPEEPKAYSRRGLVQHLLGAGATGLAAVLGGASVLDLLSTPLQAAESWGGNKRAFNYGMVIDTRRCVGCKACVAGCKVENKTPPGVSYTVVLDQIMDRPEDKPVFMTKPCFHCEHPPCTEVCPVGATFKRERDGIVVVDYERCIGCRYCMTACPYGARYFDFGDNYPMTEARTPYADLPSPEYKQFRKRQAGESPIGNVRKCSFCMHLQDDQGRYDQGAGRWPSCAKTCTGHAIHFGDFGDRESEVSRLLRERQGIRLKDELDTHPNVYYLL